MDTYIHCIESLNGKFRHPVADSFSREALRLCKEVFSSPDMQDDSCREKMMVASYLGGSAIANTYVGIVHPLSAGLSIVLGINHGLGNCLVMNVMDEFYPDEFREFRSFIDKQKIELPQNITRDLSGEQFQEMYESSIIHEKPLTNALGEGFREILTFDKVIDIFRKI
jgi:3-deoxy-alpha-D-manno-octulosonate 8-oxidase